MEADLANLKCVGTNIHTPEFLLTGDKKWKTRAQRYEQLLLQYGIQVSSKAPDKKGDKEDVPPMASQMGESPHFPKLLIDLNKWLLIMSIANECLDFIHTFKYVKNSRSIKKTMIVFLPFWFEL